MIAAMANEHAPAHQILEEVAPMAVLVSGQKLLALTLNWIAGKSGFPAMVAISGVIRS